ncbi:glutamate-cysteine ligase family protein [Streptomyces sp. NPDC094438]|uniref:carboxylate-amine ligase n=1 Tax=Streptomyces sp. NPDC094438 TaxID=3366061 RepID=UPI00380DD282
MPEDVPTVGVAEEFFLTDRRTRATVACAPAVIKGAQAVLGDQVGAELFTTIVETRTRPVAILSALRRELLWLRSGVATAAGAVGCRAVASGTAIVTPSGRSEATDGARCLRMAAEYAPLVTGDRSTDVCGCHIHIVTPDREEAVQLGNHLRPWLPTLQAPAANSPFHGGQVSGYASWRTIRRGTWPGTGPAPPLADAAAYNTLVDVLVASGMLLDRRMVYRHARPSEHCPTLEVRVADVSADLDTVLLLTGLTRRVSRRVFWLETHTPSRTTWSWPSMVICSVC